MMKELNNKIILNIALICNSNSALSNAVKINPHFQIKEK